MNFEGSEFLKNSDHRSAILLDDKISVKILIPQFLQSRIFYTIVLHCLNSQKTTINKYHPCIDYKPPFDKEEGTTGVKLKVDNQDGKIRLMTGSRVEEVLYTIKAFENKVSDLNIPSIRLIKEFMNCLGSKARDRWAKLMKQRDNAGTGPFPQTQEGWEQAKSKWIIKYAKDTSKAKDAIISAWT